MVPKPLSISRTSAKSPKVFMDVSIDGVPAGRLVILLFADQVPKTCENFRCLCTGERRNSRGKRLHYKGTSLFSVMPGFVTVGGDIENDNGTGGESIYGKYFPDEKKLISHAERGIVSMMSFENNTNGSQFFITFDQAAHLDQYHVAFGKVLGSAALLDRIEACANDSLGYPTHVVTIEECGTL